jgi:hypothetical protein
VRRLLTSEVVRCGPLLGAAMVVVLLCQASPALAVPAPPLSSPVDVGGLLGGLKSLVLGGVDWSVESAGQFIMNLLGGLVKVLIPRSWIREGLSIMAWLVAVPDYTAQITTPGGGHAYGFAGVNAMRGLFTWLGMAIAPLTLLYATSRAWSGEGDHVAAPLIRVFTAAIGVLSYTWLWGQAVALTNQITKAILGVGAVTSGIQKMFELLIAGSALAGLPLIGLVLMFVGGILLICLIFVKVGLVLVGALSYATGPLMPGIAPTERGDAISRAWLSLTGALFALAPLWTTVFAISAALINDAGSAGAILGGNSPVGKLLGGVVIAMAAIAGFFLNLKLTKALAGLVAGQLAGLLSMLRSHGGARALLGGGARAGAGTAAAAPAAAAASLRGFAAKVSGAAAGAAGALMPAGRPGAVLAGAGALAQGGLIGVGATLAGRGARGAASSRIGKAAGATRAGAVATRAARGARAGWQSAAFVKGDAGEPTGTVKMGDRTYAADAYMRLLEDQTRRLAARDAQGARGASAANPPPGPPPAPPGGRAGASTASASSGPSGASSPGPVDRGAHDRSGQPPAAKASRTGALKDRLGKGRTR